MASLSDKVFKYRSYSPIPFVILMLVFQNADVTSLIIGFAITLTGELIRLWGVSYAGSETRTTGAERRRKAARRRRIGLRPITEDRKGLHRSVRVGFIAFLSRRNLIACRNRRATYTGSLPCRTSRKAA